MARGASFALEGVVVRYGVVAAIDGIDLAIGAGESVALVGPSGAGKTTLLRLLNATARPTEGTVRVDDRRLAELSPGALRELRARIGFIPQDLGLVPNLRASRNVIAGRLGRMGFLRSLGAMLAPGRRRLEEVHAILERVGIGDRIFERTDRLSGGQRQRVAVARALYQEPRALLADEPVSSVDPARARDTLELLVRISREEGLTLVTSLHDIDLARALFPRLVGLRAGRVVLDAPSDRVDEADLERLYDLSTDATSGDGV